MERSRTGWAVAEALHDQMALLALIARKFGRPRRTIAWGESLAGLISAGLVQQFPTHFAGALPVCGLVEGGLGIPVGLALHREIRQLMGQIATGTDMPPGFFDLINHAVLPLLALAGVAIAAVGAWVPAQWAASSGVAEVLQAE